MPGDVLDLCIREKRYGARPPAVLRDVRLRAGPGEVLALLGRSGAGKSTLLRIALGLDRAFDGQVTQPAGRFGVVFQEPLLLPWLTVAENLRLVVTDGVPEPDIPALLAAVGLADAAALRPGQLSLGMARRVSVARALAVDPALLVLDEPFVSLDRRLAAALGGLLVSRAQQQRTLVLIAMHDVEHALAIADRILVLHGQPAVLAADLAVPDRGDTAALAALRRDLFARFAFLAAGEPHNPNDGRNP
jgi:NitT/TauT family transport system ATP-binding protein